MPDERFAHRPVVEPNKITLFDKYGNALTARWIGEAVQVYGGVLILDNADADLLAAFITREDEGA